MSFDEIREAKDMGSLVSPDIWNMVCMVMLTNPTYASKMQMPHVNLNRFYLHISNFVRQYMFVHRITIPMQ